VLGEKEFELKIEHFSKLIKDGLRCEILPKINKEIFKKLSYAASQYSEIIRSCRDQCRKIVGDRLKVLPVSKQTVNLLERAFEGVFFYIERKHYPSHEIRRKKVLIARVVEASVVIQLWETMNRSGRVTIDKFFDEQEDLFSKKYTEFCDENDQFMQSLNATLLEDKDVPKTTKKLRSHLESRIHNSDDVDALCEAIGRMYQTNRWCAFVSTDYGDMIKNRNTIDRLTLLVVADPIYFVYHLDEKIDLALKPRDGATKTNIPYDTFIARGQPQVGVV